MNPPDPRGRTIIDSPSTTWPIALQAAINSALTAGIVTGGIFLISGLLEEVRRSAERKSRNAKPADAAPEEDDDEIDNDEALCAALDAADLLGVPIDATETEIRSALRARFKQISLHPDHGGDEETAKSLIAAKNLLIERARAVAA